MFESHGECSPVLLGKFTGSFDGGGADCLVAVALQFPDICGAPLKRLFGAGQCRSRGGGIARNRRELLLASDGRRTGPRARLAIVEREPRAKPALIRRSQFR